MCLFLQNGTRDQGDVIFNSTLGVIFGVKKYADALWRVVERRGIKVNLQRELVMIRPQEREAVFDVLDPEASKDQETFQVNTYVCCSFGPVTLHHIAQICATQAIYKIFRHLFAMLSHTRTFHANLMSHGYPILHTCHTIVQWYSDTVEDGGFQTIVSLLFVFLRYGACPVFDPSVLHAACCPSDGSPGCDGGQPHLGCGRMGGRQQGDLAAQSVQQRVCSGRLFQCPY